MATGYFTLDLTLNGKSDALFRMLSVFKSYVNNEHEAYFSHEDPLGADGTPFVLDELSEENLSLFLQAHKSPLKIKTLGPFGHYFRLNEVGMFRKMAQEAPEAFLEADIMGAMGSVEQSLHCVLRGGHLRIETTYDDGEGAPEAYMAYLKKVLPYEKFIRLFGVDGEFFDEDAFEEFVEDNLLWDEVDLTELDFEDFEDLIDAPLSLSEEGFALAQKTLQQEGLLSFELFRSDCGDEFVQTERLIYDPIEKSYVQEA